MKFFAAVQQVRKKIKISVNPNASFLNNPKLRGKVT